MALEYPEVLWNEDGSPQFVRRFIAQATPSGKLGVLPDVELGPRQALRALTEAAGGEWILDDLGYNWIQDDTFCRYRLSDYRDLVDSLRPVSMAHSGQTGWLDSADQVEIWESCPANHPSAVPYWELPF